MKIKFLILWTIFLVVSGTVFGQNNSAKSEVFPGTNVKIERGDISEIKGKKRVYVSSFSDAGFTDNAVFKQKIAAELNQLEIVDNVEDADFSVRISAMSGFVSPADAVKSVPNSRRSDSIKQSQCQFLILTRGEKQTDGSYALRILHEKFTVSQNCQDDASRFIGGLIKKVNK